MPLERTRNLVTWLVLGSVEVSVAKGARFGQVVRGTGKLLVKWIGGGGGKIGRIQGRLIEGLKIFGKIRQID